MSNNIPPFFDPELYKLLKLHIEQSMQHFVNNRGSDSGADHECLFCHKMEEFHEYKGWSVTHKENCVGPKFIEMCDLALAMFV